MIEKMLKMSVAAREKDREAIVEKLADLGALHLTPFLTDKSDETAVLIKRKLELEKALKVLSTMPDVRQVVQSEVPAEELVEAINNTEADLENFNREVSNTEKQLAQQKIWGNLKLEDIEALGNPRFFAVRGKVKTGTFPVGVDVFTVPAENGENVCVVFGELSEKPKGVREITFPTKDNVTLKAELEEFRQKKQKAQDRIYSFASVKDFLKSYGAELGDTLHLKQAEDGGFDRDGIFVLRGWVPESRKAHILEFLEKQIDCGVMFEEPTENDNPPTLVSYPKFIKPIAGLFDVLSVAPGYKEADISPFFMIALPIFSAVLVGDAGYGLVLLIAGILARCLFVKKIGVDKANLIIVIAATITVYGFLIGSFFGMSPYDFAKLNGCISDGKIDEVAFSNAKGLSAIFGYFMFKCSPLWQWWPEETGTFAVKFSTFLMQLSFLIGYLHLFFAHLKGFLVKIPDQRCLADIGWCVFLLGILGAIWVVFFEKLPVSNAYMFYALGIGAGLIALFSAPSRNPIKRVTFGILGNLLSWLSSFSDMMSYIRLMAIGLASFYIAGVINSFVVQVYGVTDYQFINFLLAMLIAVVGHTFNIALGLIAVLAHGVRLNMLEFSNNVGVQWAGYDFVPFTRHNSKGE